MKLMLPLIGMFLFIGLTQASVSRKTYVWLLIVILIVATYFFFRSGLDLGPLPIVQP